MKGYRFYAEMSEARKSKSASKANPFFPWTVNGIRNAVAMSGEGIDLLAVPLSAKGQPLWQGSTLNCDAIASPAGGGYCDSCSTSHDYLVKRCTRIPESLARQLSPMLFAYLES